MTKLKVACKNCFYCQISAPQDQPIEGMDTRGECRKNAPSPYDSSGIGAYWPIVEIQDDWCGEYLERQS